MCSFCTSILSYFIFRLLGNPLPLYRKKPQTYMYQLSRSWQVVKYCQLKLPCFLMFTKMMYSDNENHRVKKHLNIFLTITIPNYLKHSTASNWNIANKFIPFIIHLTVLCPDSIYTCPGLWNTLSVTKTVRLFWDKLSTDSFHWSQAGRQQLFH